MTKEEAKATLYEWQEMMVRNGVPLDTSKVQALRVAIEALSAPTDADLISRQDAIDACCNGWNNSADDCIRNIKRLPSARPTDGDLISRQDAIDAICEDGTCLERKECYEITMAERKQRDVDILSALPSARPTVDCTKFMEWLKAEALDEENWELNGISNGEIICRKFKKLGWLDVEDGFYVDARPTGEWIHDGYDHPHGIDWMHCSVCGKREPHVPAAITNYCPNCGADMRGGEDE